MSIYKHYLLVSTKPRLPEKFRAQQSLLRERVATDGLETIERPAFSLEPVERGREVLQAFGARPSERSRLMVFVSPSALEFGLAAMGHWPSGVFCGLMGGQSAKLAIGLGVPPELIIAPQFTSDEVPEDSSGLQRLIEQRFDSSQLEVLVCRGPRGRSEFHTALRRQGFALQLFNLYDRKPIDWKAEDFHSLLGHGKTLLLWITSSEAATVIASALSRGNRVADAVKTQAYVLTSHPRISAKCTELGFARVIQIGTGIESVENWIQNHYTQNNRPMTQNSEPSKSESVSAPAETPTPVPTATQTPKSSESAKSDKTDWSKPALLLALLALVASGAIWFDQKVKMDQARIQFTDRLQEEIGRSKLIQEQLAKTDGLYRDLKARFDLLEDSQKEAASQRAILESVYSELMASRAAVSLSEIDQLVSIARRQLFVLGNVDGAKVALSQAVELLETTDEPSLVRLRTSIEKDLVELKGLPQVDLMSLAIQLDSVIDSIETLPTLTDADAQKEMTLAELSHGGPGQKRIDPVQHSPNLFQAVIGGIGSMFTAIWEDIKGLVEITRVEDPAVLRLSGSQVTDLKSSLRLALLNARISLLSRHVDLLGTDLNRSRAILSTYFDQNNVQVQRALKVLEDVSKSEIAIQLPTLGNSVSALEIARSVNGGGGN